MEAKNNPVCLLTIFYSETTMNVNIIFRPCGSACFEDTLVQLHTFRSLSCIRLLLAGAYEGAHPIATNSSKLQVIDCPVCPTVIVTKTFVRAEIAKLR